MKVKTANRILHFTLAALTVSIFSIALTRVTSAQCVDHPMGKTALKLNSESSYDLTFFIDEDEKEVVPARTLGAEWEVEPAEHILRARATVRGAYFWVYVGNEVPKGQVCTWSVDESKGGGISGPQGETAGNLQWRKRLFEDVKYLNNGVLQ